MSDKMRWEYQSDCCDVWQLAHLCNFFADSGWEPIAVTDSFEGQKVAENVDGSGRKYEAMAPKVVLFRRPSGWGDEEADGDA